MLTRCCRSALLFGRHDGIVGVTKLQEDSKNQLFRGVETVMQCTGSTAKKKTSNVNVRPQKRGPEDYTAK